MIGYGTGSTDGINNMEESVKVNNGGISPSLYPPLKSLVDPDTKKFSSGTRKVSLLDALIAPPAELDSVSVSSNGA